MSSAMFVFVLRARVARGEAHDRAAGLAVADETVVVEAGLGVAHGEGGVVVKVVIGPQRRADEAHAADDGVRARQEAHVAADGRGEPGGDVVLQDVAVVLVVARDDHGGAVPAQRGNRACAAAGDVAGGNEDVARRARREGEGIAAFEVQVGQDAQAHGRLQDKSKRGTAQAAPSAALRARSRIAAATMAQAICSRSRPARRWAAALSSALAAERA